MKMCLKFVLNLCLKYIHDCVAACLGENSSIQNTIISIQLEFISINKGIKYFTKYTFYIKFVLQFVRNDNYTVIYGVYHMYIQWIE